MDEAQVAHDKAVAAKPEDVQPRHELIRGLMLLGETERAGRLIREWLAEDADNPAARHLLAACTQDEIPPRASDAYVEQVFDKFAATFDSKLKRLDYRGPELVVRALQDAAGAPTAQFDICDAGCGTGLCGPGLRPWARHLAGCDLSVGMLRHAELTASYDALHHAELTHYLADNKGAFDAVASADTLCYFGALDAAAAASAACLRPEGWLIFTVEALPEERGLPHLLLASGRYAHSAAYVRQALQQAGFEVLAMVAETLRMEASEPVPGWLVSARRP